MKSLCACLSEKPALLRALRVFKRLFAILVPVAAVVGAAVITLVEGDWWFNLFLAYLGAIVMLSFAGYASLLTLLGMLTSDGARGDMGFEWVLRRILFWIAIAGVLSAVPFALILLDVLHGAWALPHFICGGVLIVLHAVRGALTLWHRRVKP